MMSNVMNAIRIWTKALLVLAAVALAVGCGSKNSSRNNNGIAPLSIGVVGVTLAPGVESGSSKSAMSVELQEIVRSEGQYQTLRSEDVETALNTATPGSYRKIVNNFGENGWLRGEDMRALFNANLPVQSVLLARVEMNDVRSGAPKRIPVTSSNGYVFDDRERVVLSTIREMRLHASLLNLETGKVVWAKTYRATPSAESSYVKYSGDSFGGSLAASVANTMTNGLSQPAGPKSPSSFVTLRSLMSEVVKNLPRR